MGAQHSKKKKQKGKFPNNKDIKNVTTKEAEAKRKTDFKYGKANDLTGNPSNTASTSEELGPAHLVNDQMEPSDGNEAVLTRMNQVSAADVQEQSTDNASSISQSADQVKLAPYCPSPVRVTQQHTSAVKHKHEETSTPKPLLQQATSARPTTGHRDVNKTAGTFDFLSDILQLRPPVQVLKNTKCRAPEQQQTDRQVIYGYTRPEESRSFTPSQQKPAAMETTEVQTVRAVSDTVHNCKVIASAQLRSQMFCKDTSPQEECGFASFGSKEQQEVITQHLSSKMPAPVYCIYRESARPEGNLHAEEARVQANGNPTTFPSQNPICGLSNVNKASTDFTSNATDEAHNIARQSTSIYTSAVTFTDVPATKPTGSNAQSTQMSDQPKAHVSNSENKQKHCLNHNSVTNLISVDYQYCFIPKSEKMRANATRMRLRKKLANKLKAQRRGGNKSTLQSAEDPFTTVPESLQQQGVTAIEENMVEKHTEAHVIPQPNRAGNGNTLSCIQTVSVKVEAPHVSMVEGRPTTAPNNAGAHSPRTTAIDTSVKLRLQCEPKVSLPQDTAVKPKKNCTPKDHQNQPNNTGNVTMKEEVNGKNGQDEEQEPASTPVTPEHQVSAKGRWQQFTVNQSCSHKARCQHNPGKELPPNVKKWYDESPNCETPWVTTARLTVCLALRQKESNDEDCQE